MTGQDATRAELLEMGTVRRTPEELTAYELQTMANGAPFYLAHPDGSSRPVAYWDVATARDHGIRISGIGSNVQELWARQADGSYLVLELLDRTNGGNEPTGWHYLVGPPVPAAPAPDVDAFADYLGSQLLADDDQAAPDPSANVDDARNRCQGYERLEHRTSGPVELYPIPGERSQLELCSDCHAALQSAWSVGIPPQCRTCRCCSQLAAGCSGGRNGHCHAAPAPVAAQDVDDDAAELLEARMIHSANVAHMTGEHPEWRPGCELCDQAARRSPEPNGGHFDVRLVCAVTGQLEATEENGMTLAGARRSLARLDSDRTRYVIVFCDRPGADPIHDADVDYHRHVTQHVPGGRIGEPLERWVGPPIPFGWDAPAAVDGPDHVCPADPDMPCPVAAHNRQPAPVADVAYQELPGGRVRCTPVWS
jgi:hypothetical protein